MAGLENYLTIKQAAAYLGVSPNTLRNWGADGKIAVHRNPMNGYRLFKVRDLERLLTDVERSAAAARPARRPK